MQDDRSDIVMGVDPGLAKTGFALIRFTAGSCTYLTEGTIVTKKDPELGKNEDTRRRVADLSAQFRAALAELRPGFVAIEEFSFYKGQQAPMAYLAQFGRVLGMMHEVLRQQGIDNIELPTRTIKRLVVGHGGSARRKVTKETVKRAVQWHIGLTPNSEHTADALAAAIAGAALRRTANA